MLEENTHKHIKRLTKYQSIDWEHKYSFGRIIARFLRKRENLLINSEILLTDKWYVLVLIPLLLNEENSNFVINPNQIQFIKEKSLTIMRDFGFQFSLKSNEIICPNHRVNLLTFDDLLNKFDKSEFNDENLILTEAHNIQENLRDKLRVSLHKKDWLVFGNKLSPKNKDVIKLYDSFKKQFFLKAIPNKKYVFLEEIDKEILKRVFLKYSIFSEKFSKLYQSILSGWACWVILDKDNFEWILNVEPIDPFDQIKELLSSNNTIFLSSLRKDIFVRKSLENHNIKINSALNFKSSFLEKQILIYSPKKEMLPNNPLFVESIIDKCVKYSYFCKGVSTFLSDENDLKINLATNLASIYGAKVLLEEYKPLDDQLICSSFDWWIKNCELFPIPNQIFIPILPFPNMGEPINQITVSYLNKKSKDWFKEFILPETLQKIERAVFTLRKNSGKLIILDGRITKRDWGRKIIQMIQPQKEISCLFPF
tara:strand:- start:1140 stop:2585 length:1446 start_codon:yes stop_codon:yes gene_type:complete